MSSAWVLTGSILVGGGLAGAAAHRWYRHANAVRRLHGDDTMRQLRVERRTRKARRVGSRFIISALVGLGVAAGAWFGLGLSAPLSGALGLLSFLVSSMIEHFLTQLGILRLETQLAEAIDMTVSALGAGASPTDALDLAAKECPHPLHPYLKDFVERLRLGESPTVSLAEFERRLPLESVRMFRFALEAHWEGGGEVGPTLASVARSARDRVALVQRVQSQSAEAQASVVGVLAISYGLAILMWRAAPARMDEFLASETGGWLVPGAVVLQALGLLWINRITKVEL